MSCDEYERLEMEHTMDMEQYAQYTYEQNRHLRGTSERESKRIAKAAMQSASLKRKQMSWHRQTCPECNKLNS